MLAKIRLGSVLMALFLFFLPWLDLQCSGKSMVTQTGLQAVYGGASPAKEMARELESMDAERKSLSAGEAKERESMGMALWVGLAFVLVVGAAVCSWLAMFRPGEKVKRYASILPVAALGCLLMQLAVGFPLRDQIAKALAEGGPGKDSMEEAMAAAMMLNLRVEILPVFYLELLLLGVPTLILVNRLIDRYRRDEEAGRVVG